MLTKKAFRAWLASLPAGAPLPQPGRSSCPLERWIVSTGRGDDYTVVDKFAYSPAPETSVPLPEWAIRFVQAIDNTEAEAEAWGWSAGEVLRVLDG